MTLSVDAGYFMRFDTSKATVGKSALLESRILYPKRKEQCLQFFYKMVGPAGDRLFVWVRTDDGTGNVCSVKKVHTITGTVFRRTPLSTKYINMLHIWFVEF